MKNIILTIVFLFVAISCKAQLNYLNNDTELFDEIKFNNVSLGDIMIASGDLTKMKALFGSDILETPNNTGFISVRSYLMIILYLALKMKLILVTITI
jgi:hypothetical protein